MPDFDSQLSLTRQVLFSGEKLGRGGVINRNVSRHGTPAVSPTMGYGELDLDGEFLKNVVVLEEFVKELLAVLVMHGELIVGVIANVIIIIIIIFDTNGLSLLSGYFFDVFYLF
jgi:hypothetical protein